MILFVAGIDTDIGKTVATGQLARRYAARGRSVVTQKLVQTGCGGFSDDILVHRKIMGLELLIEDRQGLTCPYTFRFPGSPHLAAALEGKTVDLARLAATARELAGAYELVLVEGAGGLCVPLTDHVLTIDFVAEQGWPVILVSSPRLGSINHTLLSLEALRARGLPLESVVYNLYHPAKPEIVRDSRRTIENAIRRMGFSAPLLDLPDQTSPTRTLRP